jgi:hypothetical protein
MNEIAQEHYSRFQHNVALAQRIIKTLPADSDWSCVVMFYAALHLITAYLAAKHNVSFDPTESGHPERKRAMEKCPELRDSPLRYRHLKDISEQVRYDPGFVFGKHHLEQARGHLSKITSVVEPKLKTILGKA